MRIYNNFDLTNYNGYRIHSFCKIAYFPENEEDVVKVITKHPDLIFLGSGHNIILSKEFFDQPFLIFNSCFNHISFDYKNQVIEVEAGATLKDLSSYALDKELSGLEVFYDIPSSVGGAIVMNAGTKEGEIKDVIIKVRYLDLLDFKIKEIDSENIGFQYRNSLFQKTKKGIILKAWFKLIPGDPKLIRSKMEETKAQRWQKQPREFPNCGSVFKRPEGRFVGPMLDELGLKGYRIGDAMVSPKHSGFIVNMGNATGEEILELIGQIKSQIKEKFGIDLEVEQRII